MATHPNLPTLRFSSRWNRRLAGKCLRAIPYLSAIIITLLISSSMAADVPEFAIGSADIESIVLEAEPVGPWIFILRLTEEKLKAYHAFTTDHRDSEISLVVLGTEIYRPMIAAPVNENPLTFRMMEKERFLAILTAFTKEPE